MGPYLGNIQTSGQTDMVTVKRGFFKLMGKLNRCGTLYTFKIYLFKLEMANRLKLEYTLIYFFDC